MTTEEKQLLLKDLCARLPYGVMAKPNKGVGFVPARVTAIIDHIIDIKVTLDGSLVLPLDMVQPYLRPMSSMTEEEEILFRCELPTKAKTDAQLVAMRMELFLKGHLDYNHLIEKGLALEAPEDMYKTE